MKLNFIQKGKNNSNLPPKNIKTCWLLQKCRLSSVARNVTAKPLSDKNVT